MLVQLLPYKLNYKGAFAQVARENSCSYLEWGLQDPKLSLFHWEFLGEREMRGGKEAVLARGSPRGGAEVYTFWINQDIIVPVNQFAVSGVPVGEWVGGWVGGSAGWWVCGSGPVGIPSLTYLFSPPRPSPPFALFSSSFTRRMTENNERGSEHGHPQPQAKMKAEIGADHRAESASSGQFGPVRVKSNQFEPARIDRTTSFDSTGIGVGIFTSAVTCFCARSMALLGTAFRGYGAVEWGRRMGPLEWVATNVGTNDTYPYNGAGRGERAKQRSHIASATTVLAQRPVCVWMRMRMCPKHQGPIPWDHGQIKLGSRAASRITFRCR